jgi:phage baseplate assembly protein W
MATYSDFNTSFAIHPIKKDLSLKADEESVKQSIKNLLLTDRGERPFNNALGSNVRALLFENYTPQTMVLFKRFILETVENFEPRAIVKDIDISPDPDNNSIVASIIFRLINRSDDVQLDVILERVR